MFVTMGALKFTLRPGQKNSDDCNGWSWISDRQLMELFFRLFPFSNVAHG